MAKATTKTVEATTTTKPALTENQVLTLETLANAPKGLTRKQLAEKTGIQKGWSKRLGAVTKGEAAPGSLEGDGLVHSAEIDGVNALVYTITAKGKKALADSKK